MDIIRNHTQHRDFPVHEISYLSALDEADKSKVGRSLSAYARSRDLLNNPRINSRFKKEIENQGDRLSLTPLVREYIEALGRINSAFRSSIADDLARFDFIVNGAIERAKTELGASFIAAVKNNEDGQVVEEETLLVQVIERRRYLERRTSLTATMAKSYVTSKLE
jgi:hypothetical protein